MAKGIDNQPVNRVEWLHRDELDPNDYNPNRVAPPEMKLLAKSIICDGWTQPIVANEDRTIVDGFHRWTVAGEIPVYRETGGMVPVVTLKYKGLANQQASTIRHNRARGTHGVLPMARIIENMIMQGLGMMDICQALEMEREEVVRLANRKGIPNTAIIEKSEWSKAWMPE